MSEADDIENRPRDCGQTSRGPKQDIYRDKMKFSKVLAVFYHKWLRDSYDSIDYCIEQGRPELAEKYRESAKYYFEIIINNWDAIEFFSVGDNAFVRDSALPEQFRGYE